MTSIGCETGRATAVYDVLRRRVREASSAEKAQRAVLDVLPPENRIIARNRAISSMYAAAYLRHPELLKWAGMAAFASNHARLLMRPLQLLADRSGRLDFEARGRLLRGPLRDFDTVRRINNGIFEDIFWAHLVYDAQPDGLERLRSSATDTTGGETIIEGFEAIEGGRRATADGNPDEGRRLVWAGNCALLRHEQEKVVQPMFEGFSCGFARAFSVGSSLDFEARTAQERLTFFTSFYWHILVRRRPELADHGRWPRIDKLPLRWSWIVDRIVPGFRRFEVDSDRVCRKLTHLMQGSESHWSTVH